MKQIYRRFRTLLLTALIFALLGTFWQVASTQTGGSYDLSWNSIDGGGGMDSSGGSYSLGGTVGQAEAQQPASAGGYDLQGGFWHEACAPQLVPMTIACSGNQVDLSWTADPANLGYDVYRATSPYVLPLPANKQGSVSGSHWTDPQAGTCGAAGTNYFYVVRATCVGGHVDNGEKAEFDFPVVPGN